ncbi:MAG: hypothetical protein ABJC04_07340, partial [Verrucomicrobiota bacterium]
MNYFQDNSRRVIGAIFLGASLLMLVLGLSVFWTRLSQIGFVFYWLICFLCSGAAALIALVDMA